MPAIDFSKPRFNTYEAAKFIGCAPYTVKHSRTTGILLGKPGPKYRKMGKSVTYERVELVEWMKQFPEYQNTAEANQSNRMTGAGEDAL